MCQTQLQVLANVTQFILTVSLSDSIIIICFIAKKIKARENKLPI